MSRDILLREIDPDSAQPRKVFDADELRGLADSLATAGQAVPITVRSVGDRYVIVTGERRYRAAQSLGWVTIRADVQDVDDATATWRTLAENIQRADLMPLEEAHAYQRLVDAGHTQTEIAGKIGKSQSYVAQKLRLLQLPAAVQDLLIGGYSADGALTESHARQLLRLAYPEQSTATRLERLATEAVTLKWSVRRLQLEVDYQQMTHDGFLLMPIDDRWTVKDLVQLGEAFRGSDVKRYTMVERRLSMIRAWCERLDQEQLPLLAAYLREDAKLSEVYWFTKQCVEWERRWEHEELGPPVSLFAWIRHVSLAALVPEHEEREKAAIMAMPIDGLADQAGIDAIIARLAEFICTTNQNYLPLLAEYGYLQEGPATVA